MLKDCLQGPHGAPSIDFAAHAKSLGALAENVKTISQLEDGLKRARVANRTYLLCIATDAARTTEEGGCWWEVVIPEVSQRKQVKTARTEYERARLSQKV
jgi:3D-(3,5/4)-trihydroxycyclohexane-1,2-dione acylhydrolase (decyclizing)